MEVIQVAISDSSYATALREMLARNGTWEVRCVEVPDLDREEVMVVECDHLSRLPMPLMHPERVVLVARKDPLSLSSAWDAGVNSVIFDKDPLNTAVLAVMAAHLRVAKARRGLSAENCSACGRPLPGTDIRKQPCGAPECSGGVRMVAGRSSGRTKP
ncbi:MAG: hypothetical protein NTY38_01400 [Acidobacteria bacterium]|nr:hypothetical protein [Acidobacteriota bacterium]